MRFRYTVIHLRTLMRNSLLFLLLLFAGCSMIGREVEFKGNIFIVAGDGQNIKLELVEIHAFTAEEMKGYTEQVTPLSESEKDKLQKIYDAAKSEYKIANIDLANARSVLMVASNRREDELERMNASVNELGFKQAQVISLAATFESKKAAMQSAKAKLEKFPTAEFFFQHLPVAHSKAISDSNGNFTLKLPNKGRFVLSAHSTKMVLDKQQNYYWLLRINADGKSGSPFILSNNNLMTVDSPDNLKKVASMTF
jgi:hypothetical protein